MFQNYEVIILFNPEHEPHLDELKAKYKNLVEADNGKVHKIQDWGKLSTAYLVKKLSKANYVVFNIECEPSTLHKMEKDLGYSSAALRYISLCGENAIGDREPFLAKIKAYLGEGYRIMSARANRVSAKQQRQVRVLIERARFLALIPYCDRHG